MRSSHLYLLLAMLALATPGCNCRFPAENRGEQAAQPGIHRQDWGMLTGKPVYLYTLTNGKGMSVMISNYGGTITRWTARDSSGQQRNLVVGFDSLSGYLARPPYFGALIGRYANRIGLARFSLDGHEYRLAANDGRNHLHGGLNGFDKKIWEAEELADSIPELTLKYLSPDGEEGYPGNLMISATYRLTDSNALSITYRAKTDRATPVNLTNHSYFNLSGDPGRPVLDENLVIDADHYTPVDSTLIPTGEIRAIGGTPFDFRHPQAIGSRIAEVKGGYDHNFVLNHPAGILSFAASLQDPGSGFRLLIYTTEPGLQFYSGNFLDGKFRAASGQTIGEHDALCLEPQHFPDSPHRPDFPSVILRPGETYFSQSVYRVILP